MTAVFREKEKKGRKKDLFGEHVYIATQPINGENHEKEAWASKIRHHGTVMRNMGEVTFPGLKFLDAVTNIERFEVAADGSGVSITTSVTTSVRELLYKLKARDGNQLWQTLYLSWDGEWMEIFIGVDEGTIT